MTSEKNIDRLKYLADIATDAQKIAGGLNDALSAVERQQITVAQSSIVLGNNILRILGEVEKRGTILTQIIDLLSRNIENVSSSDMRNQRNASHIQSSGENTLASDHTSHNNMPISYARADKQLAGLLARAVSRGFRNS